MEIVDTLTAKYIILCYYRGFFSQSKLLKLNISLNKKRLGHDILVVTDTLIRLTCHFVI